MLKFLHPINFIVILTLFCGCGTSDSTTSTINNAPITPTYDVKYTDDTLIINDDDGGAILDIDKEKQIYTFDTSRFSTTPIAGNVIVVEGKYMRKVTSTSIKNGNLIVKTEDATLTDVIQDGTIAWDVTPEWSSVESIKLNGAKVLDLSQHSQRRIETVISNGGIDHKIIIDPIMKDGKISSCSFEFIMVKKIGGKAKSSFSAKGTITLPNQQTRISITKGKLESFKAENRGIAADLELSLAAAGDQSGSHSFKLPEIALSVPIRFIPTPSGPIPLPVPVSIDIGIQFVTQINIPDAKSSATAKSRISITADSGFQYEGTTVNTTATLGKSDISGGEFDSASLIGSLVDIQFGVAFPRIGLNIAGQEMAYVHTGFTTGSSLTWGPVCKSGYTKVSVEGGYALKVLGQTLSEKKKVFAQREKKVTCN